MPNDPSPPNTIRVNRRGVETISDVLFHLVYTADGAQSRFDTLSSAQREAVRAFLLLRLADPDREFVRPMIEAALRDYWIARGG